MRYYDELATYERDGYDIIVDKTWEDFDPRGCFDTEDADDICCKIRSGDLDWFQLRVRVLVEGLEIGSAYLGCCCYENAGQVLTDDTATELVDQAMREAESKVYRLSRVFLWPQLRAQAC